jgi:hypothetical protein
MEIKSQDLIAGTTFDFEEYFDDYPSSEYDCQLVLKKGSDSPFPIDATASTETTDAFTFLAEAEETTKLSNGDYLFQYIFTQKDGGKVSAPREFSGSVLVEALLSSSQDTRSADQKVLDSLIEQRQKIAERDYTSMGTNGKQAQFKELRQIDADIHRYKIKLGLVTNPLILNSF